MINSWTLLKLLSIELVMPSNHLILCCPLLLLPSIFPIIRVFSNESALHIRWPKYWSFSFTISPSNEYSGLISFPSGLIGLISFQSKGLSRVFSKTTVQKHQFFSTQLSSHTKDNPQRVGADALPKASRRTSPATRTNTCVPERGAEERRVSWGHWDHSMNAL